MSVKITLTRQFRKYISAAFCLIFLFTAAGCGNDDPTIPNPMTAPLTESVANTTVPPVTTAPDTATVPVTELVTIPAADAVRNPFTNAIIDEETLAKMPKRPILVTIGNNPAARPQSSLDFADLVYEIPAESGISRYLAVFYATPADKIGPVRSARPYLLDIAKEWNAVYVHVGGSPDALSILEKGSWPYVNEFAYGSYFWRDNTRVAPNNLYTSTENLIKILNNKKWNTEQEVRGFKFLPDGEKQQGDKALSISVNYASAKNTYAYDEKTGLYNRFISSEAQLDGTSKTPIQVANIIVQHVKSKRLDDEGRLEINMYAGGKAVLFSQGVVKNGTWSRKDSSSPTVFVGEDGVEWELASGKTWIQVVDQDCSVTYKDSL